MFSDETTILGLLDTHTDISGYTLEVKKSAKLCDSQHLIANTKKAEKKIFLIQDIWRLTRFILTNSWGYILTVLCLEMFMWNLDGQGVKQQLYPQTQGLWWLIMYNIMESQFSLVTYLRKGEDYS